MAYAHVSARDALRYATDSELLKLYVVLVGLLAGAVAFLSAVVAIAQKVIAES